MAVWQVKVDGKVYEVSGGNTPPNEQQARQAVGQFKEPGQFRQNLVKGAQGTLRGMQQLGDYLPGVAQIQQAERIQAPQRETIKEALYNKMGGRFPAARGIAANLLDYTAPSAVIGAGLAPYFGGKGLQAAARNPATRRFMARQTPTLSRNLLQKTPVKPQYRTIKGRQVDITQPLPTNNPFSVDYITRNLVPRAKEIISKNIERFGPGIEKFARDKLKIPQSSINTIKGKGVRAVNAVKTKYQNTDQIYQKITQGLENKRLQINEMFRKPVDSFKGTIDASRFRTELGKILRDNQWIDQVGNPTNRFGKGINKTLDQLTRLHQTFRTIHQGKQIKGFKINKQDFLNYRDMLSGLLRDNPADRFVQQLKNTLYNSAESSGMKGIVAARNAERVFQNVNKNLTQKGLIGERGLSKLHKMTQEQLRSLKELEYYLKDPFLDDLAKMTAAEDLAKVASFIDDIPGQPSKIYTLLQKATSGREFTNVKDILKPFLGDKTDDIFNSLMRHRRAMGVRTTGKIAAGTAGASLLYSLLNKPMRSAIENISGGGGTTYTGGGQ